MRAVFIGASTLAVTTARLLLARRHEVIIIERDKERIEALADDLASGYIHGDGSKPAILREADPEHTDLLFCLTGSDQANIIASLVGRSLSFPRVVTKIDDPAFEHICIELGLEGTIIPARTIGVHLADMVEGRDPLELSTMIREEARAFSFVAGAAEAIAIDELDLPAQTRVVCVYRGGQLLVPDGSTPLREGDEVVLITHRDSLDRLKATVRPTERSAATAPPPRSFS
jgi:trk system potassium uptake protein TrkA